MGGGEETYLPDKRLTIFRSERTTPYTNLASSSKGRPALEAAAAGDALPAPWVCNRGGAAVGGGGGGAPGDWPASLNATRMPEVAARVLRGLEKGVAAAEPGAEPGAEDEDGGGRGERACETPGRSAPPSLARFGRLVRCQSW